MRARCTNPKRENYPQYGGRGIRVCARWDDFRNFLADVGERPSEAHSIGRLDNNGHYEPGNVAWMTDHAQTRNTSRNRFITFDGMTMCARDWATKLGISKSTMHYRLSKLPLELALAPEDLRQTEEASERGRALAEAYNR